jgi:hypothetical protein
MKAETLPAGTKRNREERYKMKVGCDCSLPFKKREEGP